MTISEMAEVGGRVKDLPGGAKAIRIERYGRGSGRVVAHRSAGCDITLGPRLNVAVESGVDIAGPRPLAEPVGLLMLWRGKVHVDSIGEASGAKVLTIR